MATAFEGAAAVYEQARPGYPAEAVDWMRDTLALAPGRRVLDLAAGTGKLTRALVPSGAHVIAVEPVDAMRRTLASSLRHTGTGTGTDTGTDTGTGTGTGDPATSVVAAVAQALPVGDGTLDAVTVGQAFHWFATDETVVELHRALRAGGGLCLVWNRRDQADPLQAALTGLMEPMRGDTPSHESGRWRRVFESGDRFMARGETHVRWRQPVDVDAVADRVASVSFIAAMAEDERTRLLERVRTAASDTPAPLALVYVTDVYCFTRMG